MFDKIVSTLPGLGLAIGVALLAAGVEIVERMWLGTVPVDGLVVSILVGTTLNTVFRFGARVRIGIEFAAKPVLEVAIVLLGATLSLAAVSTIGFGLMATVILVVAVALGASYLLARVLGLPSRLAMLVACGNSICGNSAIMATAPAIGAEPEDVAASIAFTAALGILVVLLLPLIGTLIGLGQWQYGVLAGLSVYAVPQVLAATVPVGALSTQIGTLVKLMRVLMLGPVVLIGGLIFGRRSGARVPLLQLVPWFVIGFLLLMLLRSTSVLPADADPYFRGSSSALTLVAMAGLGLSVDLRSLAASGGRVLLAGAGSILILVALASVAAILAAP